jgi:predicted DNA-binding protein (MmcQ/YjbR family)
MDQEQIRAFCLSLPHVTEDIKWDADLCFSIGGKMFCVMYTGNRFSVSFKVAEEAFEELSSSTDIIPAPYMARVKWIQVHSGGRFSAAEWRDFLSGSYSMVKGKLPKKTQAELG